MNMFTFIDTTNILYNDAAQSVLPDAARTSDSSADIVGSHAILAHISGLVTH